MHYTVTYRHVSPSPYLEDKLAQILGRLPGRGRVVFSRDGRAAAVSLHLTGPRLNLFLKERGADLYTLLDDLARKLSRLLKR